MSIKKFKEFSLKENKEEEIETTEIPFDKDDEHLDDTVKDKIIEEEPTSDDEHLDDEHLDDEDDIDEVETETEFPDYDTFSKKEEFIEAPKSSEGGCKIVIINGCEPDSEIDKKTEEFKSKCGCECKEIYLYQLNIQGVKKQEPKDGMTQVYEAIEQADAIILACQVNKNKLSESLETAISRIKNFYKKEELKNKIFGAIVIGNEEKIKNDLILTALNDFHMVISSDCLCFSNDKSDMKKMISSITTLAYATSLINKSGEITDKEQLEDPEENSFEDDDYIDSLKDDSDISIDDEELNDEHLDDEHLDDEHLDGEITEEETTDDKSTEEEEERLIDNQDGTITQIHKGVKTTESFEILPFDKFIK